MELARRRGIARARMLAGSVLTVVINVAVGGVIALVLLPFINRDAFDRFWWLLVCLPVVITLLHPRIVMWAANRMLALLRRQPLDVQLGLGAELRAAAWGVVSWLLLGGHVYVLVFALGASGVHAAAASIAAVCLAISAGTLVLPAPAGAGVREIAFTLCLSTMLPAATALLVALLSRVMLIVVDFGLRRWPACGLAMWSARGLDKVMASSAGLSTVRHRGDRSADGRRGGRSHDRQQSHAASARRRSDQGRGALREHRIDTVAASRRCRRRVPVCTSQSHRRDTA